MAYLNLKPVEFSAMGKKNQEAFEWKGRILLPKYDGCFCMIRMHRGKLDGVWSRTGEVVKSMDHIAEDILLRYPDLAHATERIVLLGEAWRPGTEFSVISGEFRRQSPQPQLGFAVFDWTWDKSEPGGVPVLCSNQPYSARLELLQAAKSVMCHVFPPCPVECEDEAHAWRYATALKAIGGYDGAVCSDPNAGYAPGAGKAGEFIKIKPLVTYSLEVVAVEQSVGEKTGRRVGTPVVRFKGGLCGVGTGFSTSQAERWYAYPKGIIGKIIDVACMGISTNGLMREPRFIGIRHDVITPDF